MGRSRNRLAWLLANAHRPKTMGGKVDAILKMVVPKNQKQLHGFIGAVNYYRDMWPHRSEILAPLTSQSGKKTFILTPEMQTAFEKI